MAAIVNEQPAQNGSDDDETPTPEPPKIRCTPTPTASTTVGGLRYKRLPAETDTEKLFEFRLKEGKAATNFLGDVRSLRHHFGRVAGGNALVWAAYDKRALVGFASLEATDEYRTRETTGRAWILCELVVAEGHRRRGIGAQLARVAVDAALGVFAVEGDAAEVYAPLHAKDDAGAGALRNAGFAEVVTYADYKRGGRETTLLRFRKAS